MESKVALHLAQYLLENYFRSKQAMADALGVSYRGLLRLFQGTSNEHDVEQIIYGMMDFCSITSIPPKTLFQGFAIR